MAKGATMFKIAIAGILMSGLMASGAMADKMKVVTTFTVIADMASNVAGDAAEVVSVTKPGAEIHGYQPTPRDIVRAIDADLVLWNGMNLELWFEQFLSNLLAALPEDRRWLVTCEGAFSYLARDFGMQELYLWPMNADQVGTPQQVRAVIDGVREHDVKAVFCESTVSTAPAQQVARETGARYGGELYVDSLSLADSPVPTYLDLLRVTATTIVEGLSE